MSTLAEPYPTETALAEHSKDRLTAWIAERRLPDPDYVTCFANALEVEIKTVADLYAYTDALGLARPQPHAVVVDDHLFAYLRPRDGLPVRVPGVPVSVFFVYREQ